MKLHSTFDKEEARFLFQALFQVDSGAIKPSEISRVEIYGTDVDDPGEAYCEYRVFDVRNRLVKVRRETGW